MDGRSVFHILLGHCGAARQYESIRTMFNDPSLKNRIDTCSCLTCQKYNQQVRAHDYLPERKAIFLSFEKFMLTSLTHGK